MKRTRFSEEQIIGVLKKVESVRYRSTRDDDAALREKLREPTELIARRVKPDMIVSDNGTELTSNVVLA